MELVHAGEEVSGDRTAIFLEAFTCHLCSAVVYLAFQGSAQLPAASSRKAQIAHFPFTLLVSFFWMDLAVLLHSRSATHLSHTPRVHFAMVIFRDGVS
jgi:hypothetical protein